MNPDTDPTRSQTSRDLESHWRNLAGLSRVLDLESFDLVDIPKLIPDLLVLNLTALPEPRAQIKLAGSNLNVRAGFELTGRDFLDLWERDVRPVVWSVFRKSLELPCGFILTTQVQLQNTTSAVMEVTTVPFQASDRSPPSVIMSCIWTGVALSGALEVPIVIGVPDAFSWLDLGCGVPKRSPLDF